MRAIAFDDFGSPPTLHHLSVPAPGAGEVLVRIQASSLNGFDVAVAAGFARDMMVHRFPVVLGKDFAGMVEAVGPGAARFAGALGLAGTAALQAVEAVAPTSGETVLVSGATGGVGAFVVQLAATCGARVIATARPGEETAFVRDLGATDTVDFTGDVAAQVRALSPQGVDAVLHLAGDAAVLANLLIPGGRFASTLGVAPEQLAGRDLTATSVNATPAAELLDRLVVEVAAGRLRVPIRRRYRLDEVPRALADFATPHVGKLSIAIA
ncbi:MAG: NADP-dependent oxidoreductase [Dehalococcoidia bacterium]